MTSRASDLILARLHALHPKSIDLSLGRVERLLAALGHPERRLPPVVHVAGTNGKGSTSRCCAPCCEAAGRRVACLHLAASRALQRAHPARRRADRRGPAGRAASSAARRPTAARRSPSSRSPPPRPSWPSPRRRPTGLLLETGLGGRLDATNVIERPRLTVITPISLDHESYLGDTLAKIAVEKAGILKPGVPAVIGPQQPEALAVIEARAAEVGAPLAAARPGLAGGADGGWSAVETAGSSLDCRARACRARTRSRTRGSRPSRRLQLGETGLDAAAIGRGLAGADWPARLQRCSRARLRRWWRRAPGSGSMAATTLPPDGSWPKPGRAGRRPRAASGRRHANHQGSGAVPDTVAATGQKPMFRARAGRGAGPRSRGVGRRPPPAWRPGQQCRLGRGGHWRGRGFRPRPVRRADLWLALPRRRRPAPASLIPRRTPLPVSVGMSISGSLPPGRWVWRAGFVVSGVGRGWRCSFSSLVVV